MLKNYVFLVIFQQLFHLIISLETNTDNFSHASGSSNDFFKLARSIHSDYSNLGKIYYDASQTLKNESNDILVSTLDKVAEELLNFHKHLAKLAEIQKVTDGYKTSMETNEGDFSLNFLTKWLENDAYGSYSLEGVQKMMNGLASQSGDVMQSYYDNPGYPTVVASLEKGQLHLMQLDVNGKLASPPFVIPYQYKDSTGNTYKMILRESNATVTINDTAGFEPKWFIFNNNIHHWWGAQVYTSKYYQDLLPCLDSSTPDCPGKDKVISVLKDLPYLPQDISLYPLSSDRNATSWEMLHKQTKISVRKHGLNAYFAEAAMHRIAHALKKQ